MLVKCNNSYELNNGFVLKIYSKEVSGSLWPYFGVISSKGRQKIKTNYGYKKDITAHYSHDGEVMPCVYEFFDINLFCSCDFLNIKWR